MRVDASHARRLAPAAEAAARHRRVAPRRGEQARARTEKQLVYERRRRRERTRKQKRSGEARPGDDTAIGCSFFPTMTAR